MKEDTKRFIDAAMQIVTVRSHADVARLAGVKPQVLTNWKNRGLPRSRVADLAMMVKVDPAWLYLDHENKVQPENIYGSIDIHQSKLVSNIFCSTIKELGKVKLLTIKEAIKYQDYIDNDLIPDADDQREYINCTGSVQKYTFAVEVHGDSMVSIDRGPVSFPDGSIIIVEPDQNPKNGSFVISKIGEDTGTFRKLAIKKRFDGEEKMFLIPLNIEYPIEEIEDFSNICGCVTELRVLL